MVSLDYGLTRHGAEAATSLSSQLGQHLLQHKAASTENPQELSAELMWRRARRSCSSSGTTRSVYAAWCTRGSPQPWAAPSPGSMRPQLQSRGSGGPFSSSLKMLTGRKEPSCSQDQGMSSSCYPAPFQDDVSSAVAHRLQSHCPWLLPSWPFGSCTIYSAKIQL
ncbi:hypothetical protein DV515_00002870 [Chloebia gouldiae]|uniref:Uncharacterized protein n=1 Tax=Chloebia gouldiae TaxID=44316 RepID=A0A3L8SXR3_CHLGU|nr:hypothetical protein DV515_00002870 [Chloebia gouldiae]